MRFRHVLLALALGASLFGCAGGSTGMHVGAYQPSTDAGAELHALAARGAPPIRVDGLGAATPLETSWGCRGAAHIATPGYQPVELYLRDALRMELRSANLHADDARLRLRGHIQEITLSTTIASGWWLRADFSWGEGTPFTVARRHPFPHQMQPVYACSAAASNFVPAVQGFFRALFAHPEFQKGLASGTQAK